MVHWRFLCELSIKGGKNMVYLKKKKLIDTLNPANFEALIDSYNYREEEKGPRKRHHQEKRSVG